MKSYFIPLLLMTLTASVSCSQVEPTDPNDGAHKGCVTIGAEIPMTKTHLGEAINGLYKIYWSQGDVINVNGISSESLSEDNHGQSNARFTITGISAPYSIIYPASVCEASNGSKLTLNIPTEQVYTADTFAEGANILYGYSENENATLKHLTGIYKLGLKAIEGAKTNRVKRIEIISNSDNNPVCGSFTLDAKTGELIAAADATCTISLVVKNEENDLSYKSLNSEDYTYFHIAVPAGEYKEGFTINVYDYSNSKMTGTWKPNKDTDGCLEAGVMKSITANLKPSFRAIKTENDLREFISAANAGQYGAFINPETGAVELAADIVCTGNELDRILLKWDDVFDGKEFSITKPDNIAYRSLFTHISKNGVVKNLTIKGNTDKINVWNVFKPWGTANPVMFHSAFAIKNYGTIENCHSEISINLTNTVNSSDKSCDLYIAGICAFNAGLMEDCSNKGSISIKSNNTSHVQCRVAGISLTSADGLYTESDYGNETEPSTKEEVFTILTEKDGRFVNCTNFGDISVWNTSSNLRFNGLQVAGIVANIPDGSTDSYAVVDNCKNSGSISYIEPTYVSTRNGAKIVAGIVGCIGVHGVQDEQFKVGNTNYQAPGLQAKGIYAELRNCTNTGIITHGAYANPNLTQSDISAHYRYRSYTGGILGFAHGLEGSHINIESCTNNASMYVGSRNNNGHIVGGIAGGIHYTDFNNCTARQENIEPYTEISSTQSLQVGVYGGIVGAIFTSASISNSKAFSNIYFCYTKDESRPDIQGTGSNSTLSSSDLGGMSAPSRTRYMKACGFFAGLAVDGTKITLSNCKVGGTGDFYRDNVRKAIILNSDTDLSSKSYYVFDYYILNSKPDIVSDTINELSYWDGMISTLEN